MCKSFKVFVKVFIRSNVPILILRWCILSIRGLFNFGGMVGSSYISVFAGMCMITWISGKGLMRGVKFWYQLLFGIVRMVMVWGSFFAASLA